DGVRESSSTSPPLKLGWTLGDEGGDAFGEVLGAGAVGKALALRLQLGLERGTQRLVKEPLGTRVGLRRAAREAPSKDRRAVGQVRRRHHPVDEAPGERSLRVEALAKQRYLHRALHAERARQEEGRAAVGTGAKMAIGEGVEAVLGSDREIAGHEEAHADPRDRAVHARDERE